MPISNYPDYMSPAGKAEQLANCQDYVADTYAVEATVTFWCGCSIKCNRYSH